MAARWNFREILNLYPESETFACVYTKVDSQTTICCNRRPLLSDVDLRRASELLDSMDKCDSLSVSYNYLEDLARLTLCVIHAESGLDQVGQISKRWKARIVRYQKEVESPVRPKSSGGKIVKQVQTPTRIPVPATPKTSKKSTKGKKPTRDVSHKIKTLISDVGFHDASNPKYVPPPPPVERPVSDPVSRIQRRPTGYVPPLNITKKDNFASKQLSAAPYCPTPIMTTHLGLQRQPDIDDIISPLTPDTIVDFPLPPTTDARARSETNSSTDSSMGSGSGTEAGTASSAPSSTASSPKTSPALKATTENAGMFTAMFSPLVNKEVAARPTNVQRVVSTGSTASGPLPTFDFGIFSDLPLPPGHKKSLSSPVKRRFSVSKMRMENVEPRVLAVELDTTRPSTSRKSTEKPFWKPSSAARSVTKPSRRKSFSISAPRPIEVPVWEPSEIKTPRLPFVENGIGLDSKRTNRETTVRNDLHRSNSVATFDDSFLPESDSVSEIGVGWIGSHVTRTPSRSPPTSRRASQKLSRTPSNSLSRSLSNRLSRSWSRKAGKGTPVIEEPTPRSQTIEESPLIGYLAKSSTESLAPDERVPLDKLIKMSHELSKRLDGMEDYGYVNIRPSSSYKYSLSRAPTQHAEPVPEFRFSRLFGAVNPEDFMPSFTLPSKPMATVPPRSKSVGDFRPITIVDDFLPVPEIPDGFGAAQEMTAVEVCEVCGNSQSIWGRCGCVDMEQVRRERTKRESEQLQMRVEAQAQGGKRRPGRRMTLKAIRRRVVRAFTV